MEEHRDDALPPPYSEADIFSASTASSALRPSSAHQNADDASVTASSSRSYMIYTPPQSPELQDDWAAAGGTDTSPVPASASAQAYFAARPAAGRSFGAHIVHVIHFAEAMTPADVPYPDWATDLQITEKVWHEFVNHLLGLHAKKANEYIAGRQLRAEEEGTPREAGQTMAGTQLDPTQPLTTIQVVHAWNADFFMPRGVIIRLGPDLPNRPRAGDQTAFDASRELPHRSYSRSSSSSSSGSDSSLGSLVDWDEMNNNQLPIVRQSILNWARSVEPVPKAEYQRVKAEIKAAKGARPASSAAQQKETKKLLAQWEGFKKLHKATKKLARKATKKEKKTRKVGKKESKKKTKNQERSESGEARRDGPTAGSHWAHGAFLSAPPLSALPDAPPPNLTRAFGPGRHGGPVPPEPFIGGLGLDHVHTSQRTALDGALQARKDAAVAAAVRNTQAVRDATREAALREVAASREAAQRTAAAAVRQAHATRDATRYNARQHGAETAARVAAAVRCARVTRDGAVYDARQPGAGAAAREAAQRTAAASREMAQRTAAASRETAQRTAAASREMAQRTAAASRETAQQTAAASREMAQQAAAASREAAQRTAAAATRQAPTTRDAVFDINAARDAALREAAARQEADHRTVMAAIHHVHEVRDSAPDNAGAEAMAQAQRALDAAQLEAEAREQAQRRHAAWQRWIHEPSWSPPLSWSPSQAWSSPQSWSSPQAPYSSPGDRQRAGPGEEQPSAGSDLPTPNGKSPLPLLRTTSPPRLRSTTYHDGPDIHGPTPQGKEPVSEALTFLATVVAQPEKKEASAAQAGPEDVRRDLALEIRELDNRIQALRMEVADKALAKKLAEEEARGGPPS